MSKGRQNKKYTPEFKKLVVETMQKENLGYRETGERFGIHHSVVQNWERIYLTEGPEVFFIERRGRGHTSHLRKPRKEIEEDLFSELQRLRAENEYLKNLQALVLERERRQGKKPR